MPTSSHKRGPEQAPSNIIRTCTVSTLCKSVVGLLQLRTMVFLCNAHCDQYCHVQCVGSRDLIYELKWSHYGLAQFADSANMDNLNIKRCLFRPVFMVTFP